MLILQIMTPSGWCNWGVYSNNYLSLVKGYCDHVSTREQTHARLREVHFDDNNVAHGHPFGLDIVYEKFYHLRDDHMIDNYDIKWQESGF